MANEFIGRNGIIALNNSQITGSLSVSNGITGSLFGTASLATSASYSYTASSAISSSYSYTASSAINASASLIAVSSSYAFTASSAISAYTASSSVSSSYAFNASSAISSYTASSAISSSYSITSSVAYSGTGSFTGSFIGVHTGSLFGTSSQAVSASYLIGGSTGTTFPYTGSAIISGSLTITGSLNSPNITGSLFGTSSQAVSASYAYTASSAINSSASLIAISASYALTASYFLTSSVTSASYAFTASSAISSSYSLNAGLLSGTGSVGFATTGSNSFVGTITINSPSLIDLIISGSEIITGSSTITGSLIVTGSISLTGSLQAQNITGSLFGTSSQAVSASYAYTASSAINSSASLVAISSSYALTASYLLGGGIAGVTQIVAGTNVTISPVGGTGVVTINSSGGVGSSFPYTGSAQITGSLIVTGSQSFLFPLSILQPSQSAFLISQSISQSSASGSQVYGVNIQSTFYNTTGSQTQTALRVQATFTGSFTGSATTNRIVDFGATSAGSQFTVTDQTSGSIYMVNDVSGLPIIEAKSDWTVNIWNYPNIILQKSGSNIIITGSLSAQSITGSLLGTASYALSGGSAGVPTFPYTGSAIISGSLTITGSLNSPNITGSLFGTASQAVSSSYAITASYIRGTLVATSSLPTFTANTAGLGTNGAGAIVGVNNAGILTLRIGTGPAANAGAANVVYTTAYPNGSSVILYPSNPSASRMPTGSLYASASSTGFQLSSSAATLIASVTASWNYIVMGY